MVLFVITVKCKTTRLRLILNLLCVGFSALLCYTYVVFRIAGNLCGSLPSAVWIALLHFHNPQQSTLCATSSSGLCWQWDMGEASLALTLLSRQMPTRIWTKANGYSPYWCLLTVCNCFGLLHFYTTVKSGIYQKSMKPIYCLDFGKCILMRSRCGVAWANNV